jgi:hypothetical protein
MFLLGKKSRLALFGRQIGRQDLVAGRAIGFDRPLIL